MCAELAQRQRQLPRNVSGGHGRHARFEGVRRGGAPQALLLGRASRALALLLPAQPAGAEAWGAEVGARAPADLRSYGLRCARASLLLFALFLLVWPAELLVRATGADLGLGPRGRPLLSAIEGWADLPSMRGWAPWVGQTVESGDGGRAAAEAAREARLPLMPQYAVRSAEAPASADDE